MTATTCGTLFSEMMHRFTTDQTSLEAFATGFVAGQCEKVASGACHAAMFRPGADWYHWALGRVQEVAEAYGLTVAPLAYGDCRELWVFRAAQLAYDFLQWAIVAEVNSPEWHRLRAWYCGIARDQVDETYHAREGWHQYREPLYDATIDKQGDPQ